MFDTSIEFTVASAADIAAFEERTREVHEAAYRPMYGIITAGYNSEQTEWFNSREGFTGFLREETARGNAFTVDLQYAQGMPLELECVATPR